MKLLRPLPRRVTRPVSLLVLCAWVATLAYVVILNAKLGRLERQLEEIAGMLEARSGDA